MSPPRDWQSSVFTAAPSELFETGVCEPSATPSSRYSRGPELGRGGMGVVWLVHDHWLHRDVAMKRPSGEWGAALHAQLRNEAAVNARLNHPGIAALLDLGEDEDGVYYTMPVLVGATLGERLRDPSFTLAEAIRALLLAARVVAYAHKQGVVHRDLKPDNLFLGEHGEVWVLDWGLAVDIGVVQKGWAGTRSFAAPEQGESAADPCADVFSVGRILQSVLSANEEAPQELFTVVERATASNPEERWQSVQPLIQALTDWSEGLPVASHRYPIGVLLRLWMARNRRALVAVAALAAVGLVMLASVVQARWSANQQTREALGTSLAIQAASEWAKGHQARAEVLAAASLEQSDNPVARGVRMSRSAVPPVHVARHTLPCADPFVTRRATFLCLQQGTVDEVNVEGETIRSWAPSRVSTRLKEPLRIVGMYGDDLLIRGNYGRFERWGDGVTEFTKRSDTYVTSNGLLRSMGAIATHAADGAVWVETGCTGEIADATETNGIYGITCDSGEIYLGPLERLRVATTHPHPNRILAMGREWVVTTWTGELLFSNDGNWISRKSGVGVINDIVQLDANRVAVQGERGDVRVHDLRGPSLGLSIQGESQDLAVLGQDLVVVGRQAANIWSLPASAPAGFDRSEHGGSTTFAPSPSGDALLAGHAQGILERLDLTTGQVQVLVDTDIRAAQGSVFLDDTSVLVATSEGRHTVDVVTGQTQPWPGTPTRTSVVYGDSVLSYGWADGHLWTRDGPGENLGRVVDADVSAGMVTLLRLDGEVAQSIGTGPFEVVGQLGAAGELARHGEQWWYASDRNVSLLDAQFQHVWTMELPESVTELLATSYGAVVGDLSGGLTVVGYDGDVRARLPRAHQRRIAGLVLVNDDTVWSSSYDGFVRRWTLTGLDDSVASTDVQQQWSLSLDDLQVR